MLRNGARIGEAPAVGWVLLLIAIGGADRAERSYRRPVGVLGASVELVVSRLLVPAVIVGVVAGVVYAVVVTSGGLAGPSGALAWKDGAREWIRLLGSFERS